MSVLDLIGARRGHFLLESGHHGELWLDLPLLCLRPARTRPLVDELASKVAELQIEMVCGPLVEGAFVAIEVASQLDVEFGYAEPKARQESGGLYPVEYRVPTALRERIRGRRVAIVNDVINAGSAVRGTYADLTACGAEIVGVAALLCLGSWSKDFTAEKGIALLTLASMPNRLWKPEDCPLCAQGVPLD